jgi:hypothetical protein
MRLGCEYIAGFLDCDGTVVVVRAARGGNEGFRYYGKICFYSQNLQVLKNIQETVGGKIPPPSLAVFMLQLSPRETVKALKVLIPYLQIKKEQALLVVKLHEMIDSTPKLRNRTGMGGMARLPESVYEARHVMYLRVSELNHVDSEAFRKNRENSVKPSGEEATPSQAAAANDSAEGVTTSQVSANNNPGHETPTRKGRHSLSSAEEVTFLQ